MVSTIFTESIVLISSIILAAAFSGIIISKTGAIESIFSSTTASQKENMLTKIKVVYATNTTSSTIKVWVKNIGKQPIVDLDKVDLYFGPIKSVNRIPYNTGSAPTWTYSNTSVWNIMDTKEIIINYDSTLSDTTYLLKIITPNGADTEYLFSPP
ncbi:MAG: hypothetical protein KatS3mg003_0058 [Candidatus Nitrosocaldaceae archaeon]|nr:MAG: hypothetical protein KatS3mg003_0058 [Candidatus Nitrosocaldaceae archaeon]